MQYQYQDNTFIVSYGESTHTGSIDDMDIVRDLVVPSFPFDPTASIDSGLHIHASDLRMLGFQLLAQENGLPAAPLLSS